MSGSNFERSPTSLSKAPSIFGTRQRATVPFRSTQTRKSTVKTRDWLFCNSQYGNHFPFLSAFLKRLIQIFKMTFSPDPNHRHTHEAFFNPLEGVPTTKKRWNNFRLIPIFVITGGSKTCLFPFFPFIFAASSLFWIGRMTQICPTSQTALRQFCLFNCSISGHLHLFRSFLILIFLFFLLATARLSYHSPRFNNANIIVTTTIALFTIFLTAKTITLSIFSLLVPFVQV